jgi:hypothetical protein
MLNNTPPHPAHPASGASQHHTRPARAGYRSSALYHFISSTYPHLPTLFHIAPPRFTGGERLLTAAPLYNAQVFPRPRHYEIKRHLASIVLYLTPLHVPHIPLPHPSHVPFPTGHVARAHCACWRPHTGTSLSRQGKHHNRSDRDPQCNNLLENCAYHVTPSNT